MVRVIIKSTTLFGLEKVSTFCIPSHTILAHGLCWTNSESLKQP